VTRDPDSKGRDPEASASSPATPESRTGDAHPARDQPLTDRGVRREDFCDEWIEALTAKAQRLGNYPMLTKEEREASRQSFLGAIEPGQGVWVFGYGSLMWNPALHVEESRAGLIYGHHRVFCLNMLMGRGSPDRPGLMLALDRGGSCHGMAHRIAPANVDSELRILWMREMLGGTYIPRWVAVRTFEGAVRAITFVANQRHPRYAGKLSPAAIVERIAHAAGDLGTNRYYLYRLTEHLDELGILDGPMHRLAEQVRARAGTAPG
jgi:cation transport protein ChaC